MQFYRICVKHHVIGLWRWFQMTLSPPQKMCAFLSQIDFPEIILVFQDDTLKEK